jgi:hypothetical protein
LVYFQSVRGANFPETETLQAICQCLKARPSSHVSIFR